MSPKRIGSLASAEGDQADYLTDNTVSGNGWNVPLVLSESESDFDAFDRDALQVGAATIARFKAKINVDGPVPIHRPELGPCWLWTANLVKGYGQFVLSRTDDGSQPHVYAHRFAYELIHGKFASMDIKACHHCDRPACCRPSHLFPGTQPDNLADARRKGRLVDGAHCIKVSAAGIADIKARYQPRVNGNALAKEYGIHLVTLMRIVGGYARVGDTRPSRGQQKQAS